MKFALCSDVLKSFENIIMFMVDNCVLLLV